MLSEPPFTKLAVEKCTYCVKRQIFGGKGKIHIAKNQGPPFRIMSLAPCMYLYIYFMNGSLRGMAVWMGAQTNKGGRGRRNHQEIGESIVPDKNAMLSRLYDWHCRQHKRLRVETF